MYSIIICLIWFNICTHTYMYSLNKGVEGWGESYCLGAT